MALCWSEMTNCRKKSAASLSMQRSWWLRTRNSRWSWTTSWPQMTWLGEIWTERIRLIKLETELMMWSRGASKNWPASHLKRDSRAECKKTPRAILLAESSKVFRTLRPWRASEDLKILMPSRLHLSESTWNEPYDPYNILIFMQ